MRGKEKREEKKREKSNRSKKGGKYPHFFAMYDIDMGICNSQKRFYKKGNYFKHFKVLNIFLGHYKGHLDKDWNFLSTKNKR